ncbi:hypothetical protein CHS0354_036429 [Potamilus streckersoni]|uniref:Proteasome activator complex subunit 3 n=1 Tax=Potamilus streckersoni TaxID=2493646 RepID=A0AAE0W289_9BIVA|nr:hypothetical protein CHS0354_036429 [Potamilus streckersoni]
MPKIKRSKSANSDNPKDTVTEFKEKFKSDGEYLLKNVFPQKIMELEEYCQLLCQSKVSEINCELNIPVPDPILFGYGAGGLQSPAMKRKLEAITGVGSRDIPGSKVMVLQNGTVPCNTKIIEIAEKLKPYIRDLIDHSNTLKMWIAFLIPKIEDGNNFGVAIQEETLSEVGAVENEVEEYMNLISRYFISRGKLISKVAKYPHIDDYRQCIKELDEQEFMSLRLMCCELRNNYASLYDMIIKNIEKIKKPRSANTENLY